MNDLFDDMSRDMDKLPPSNDNVTINLAMVRVGDKAREIEELANQVRIATAELIQLIQDWADVL